MDFVHSAKGVYLNSYCAFILNHFSFHQCYSPTNFIMKFFLIVLFIVSVVSPLHAQSMFDDSTSISFPDSLFRVDSVKISGNEDTKDFVILREMTLQNGGLITHEATDYNKNRIYSLGLFNRVEIEVEPTSGSTANLNVVVYEKWFIYPYPIFGLRDRDWTRLYYGLGLVHINFRGRNEKLYASFALGFDPWVSLSYRNPFLDEKGTNFLESRFSYNKVRNRSVTLQQQFGDFDEEQFNISTTFGKRFGIQHTSWVTVGYRSVSIPQLNLMSTTDIGRNDRFLQTTLGYVYDTRDLGEYPSYGSFVSLGVTKFGIFSPSVDFAHYNMDFRKFIPLTSEFVVAGKIFSVLASGGEVPSYEHVYFGYGDRIRGHYKEVMEGEDLLGASTEFHYTLLSPKYFKVGFLPKEFALWRFGITAAVFADAGTIWYRGDKINWSHLPSGYGLGLHFLMPFNIVLRAEYARNELGRGEFIFAMGSSF